MAIWPLPSIQLGKPVESGPADPFGGRLEDVDIPAARAIGRPAHHRDAAAIAALRSAPGRRSRRPKRQAVDLLGDQELSS